MNDGRPLYLGSNLDLDHLGILNPFDRARVAGRVSKRVGLGLGLELLPPSLEAVQLIIEHDA